MAASNRNRSLLSNELTGKLAMITFILIFAGAVLLIAGWLIANGANQRKRARMAGESKATSQEERGGGGQPVTGRAPGND